MNGEIDGIEEIEWNGLSNCNINITWKCILQHSISNCLWSTFIFKKYSFPLEFNELINCQIEIEYEKNEIIDEKMERIICNKCNKSKISCQSNLLQLELKNCIDMELNTTVQHEYIGLYNSNIISEGITTRKLKIDSISIPSSFNFNQIKEMIFII